jgi:hypothetical protein
LRDGSSAGDATPAGPWFGYTPDRKDVHPQSHLVNFKGVLQAGAYAGFNTFVRRRRDPRGGLLGACAPKIP